MKKLLFFCAMLIGLASASAQSTTDYDEIYNYNYIQLGKYVTLLQDAKSGNVIALAQLQQDADLENASLAANYYGIYLCSKGDELNGTKYFLKAADNGDFFAMNNYAAQLGIPQCSTYNEELYQDFKTEWLLRMKRLANQGDANAQEALGLALLGRLKYLSPDNDSPKYREHFVWNMEASRENRNKAETLLLSAANSGKPYAQYYYWEYFAPEDDNWLKKASDRGLDEAMSVMACRSFEKRNYDIAIDLSSKLSSSFPEYHVSRNSCYIHMDDLSHLAAFFKKNPDYSIKGYGPMRLDDITFYLSRNNKIYAACTYNGKAGIIALDRNGNHLKNEGIPFIYDILVPSKEGYWLEKDNEIFIHPYPHNFRLAPQNEMYHALSLTGEECFYDLYHNITHNADVEFDWVEMNFYEK